MPRETVSAEREGREPEVERLLRSAIVRLLVAIDDVREAESEAARERGSDDDSPRIRAAWRAMSDAEDRARAVAGLDRAAAIEPGCDDGSAS